MAFRERSSNLTLAYQYDNWDHQTGTPQHGYTSTAGYPTSVLIPKSTETKTTIDFVTPNFKSSIAAGAIINNPFSSVKVEEEKVAVPIHILYRLKTPYTCNLHNPTQSHYSHWNRVGDKVVSYAFKDRTSAMVDRVAAVKAAAVTEAHANIDTSEMLALATAAESGKSVQSMMSIYGRLRKILRSARRLRVAELSRELSPKELANRWMEVRYAIRPLIYDAVGLAEALQKKRGFERRTFRGYATDSMSASDTITKVQFINYVFTDFNRVVEQEVSAHAGVLCDVCVDDLTVFGIDQLVNTAWELAPLSFIVDWFVNVGDWVAAHAPKAGVRQLASWVTAKVVVTQQNVSGYGYFDFGTSAYTGVTVSVPPCTCVRVESSTTRDVNPSISSFPVVDVQLDAFKLTDLGIILRKYLR